MERIKARISLARDAQAMVRKGGVRELELRVVRRVLPDMVCDSGGVKAKVSTSARSVEILRALWGPNMDLVEEAWVLLLDRGNGVIGGVKVALGGMHGAVLDPKVVYGVALAAGASGIIMAHNHPSGQARPSEEDILHTRKLLQGGVFLGIAMFDHVILTTEGYYSFADNGMMY